MRAVTEPSVRAERVGGVLAVVIDNPPLNALDPPVRAGLAAALAGVGDARAVVLLAEGRTFSAGAEIGAPEAEPALARVLAAIEDCPVPVVAAIQGPALGEGMELALACHARIAGPAARLGLPEVTLGLMPAAGATQRLPRLIGAGPALRLMLSGRPLAAGDALAAGLVDRLAAGDLAEAAVEFAGQAPRVPARERREGMADARAHAAAVAEARAEAQASPLAAPGRIVDCVEAALLLPFAQGLEFEAAAVADLRDLPEVHALRAAFLAERRVARVPGGARPVGRVTVAGGDEQGCAVAAALLAAGLPVTLAEDGQPALVAALERVGAAQERAVAEGRLAPEARDADWARLTPALADEPAGPGEAADLVLLAGGFAGPEAPLPQVAHGRAEGAPVVTLGRAGRDAGLVLWPGRRLAEVLVQEATPPAALATLVALLRRMDRVVVQARGRGLVAALLATLGLAARRTAERQGPAAAAAVLRGWSLAIEGLEDAGAAVPARVSAEAEFRLRAALANAGLRLVGDGTAARLSDIDLALVHGLGWPRQVPGPMLWAEQRGVLVLRADLRRLAEEAPELWTPAPILDRLLHDDIRLEALND